MEFTKRIYGTDIYRNSFFTMASYGLSSLFGFFFWTMAARLYAPREVGLASTLISSINLLVSFSSLGFGVAFIRFLPIEKNKKEIINTCLSLSGILMLFLSAAFSFLAGRFIPELFFLSTLFNMSLFAIFSLFTLHNAYLDTIYISQRVAFYTFLKNLIQSLLKVALLFPLVFLGTMGVFSSFGCAMVVSFLVSFLAFMRKAIPDYSFFPDFGVGKIAGLFKFSFANYIATLLGSLSTMAFPLIITISISPEMTAYFYVAWMIGILIHLIPTSISFNFLAEGARGGDGEAKLRRVVRFTFLLLLPVVLFILVGADYILLLFKKSYAENGATLLRIMALSSFPVAVNSIGISLLNLRNEIVKVVFINAFLAVTTIFAGYLLLQRMGLSGIGIAFLFSQFIVAMFFVSQNVFKPKG